MAGANIPRHHRLDHKKEKRAWTTEETDAVVKGVERWGKGKWSSIKDDPDFGPILADRTTIDIKDKYRNLFAKKRSSAGGRSESPQAVMSNSDAAMSTRKPTAAQLKRAAAAQEKEMNEKRSKSELQPSTDFVTRRLHPMMPIPMMPMPPFSMSAVLQSSPALFNGQRSGGVVLDSSTGTSAPAPDGASGGHNVEANKSETMIVTIGCGAKSYVLNLRATTKASNLHIFVKQELGMATTDFTLFSEGLNKPLDMTKTLKEQIPMFDLVRVIESTVQN